MSTLEFLLIMVIIVVIIISGISLGFMTKVEIRLDKKVSEKLSDHLKDVRILIDNQSERWPMRNGHLSPVQLEQELQKYMKAYRDVIRKNESLNDRVTGLLHSLSKKDEEIETLKNKS